MSVADPPRSTPGRPSRARRLAAAGLALLLLVVLAAPLRVLAEQLAWSPRDEARLAVESWEWAPGGVVLTVRAAATLSAVWRQDSSPWPWRAQHHLAPFRVQALDAGRQRVLVPYPFVPEREWLLALRTSEGVWTSLSPFTAARPELDQTAWDALWRRAAPAATR